jgi:hypothetical protein
MVSVPTLADISISEFFNTSIHSANLSEFQILKQTAFEISLRFGIVTTQEAENFRDEFVNFVVFKTGHPDYQYTLWIFEEGVAIVHIKNTPNTQPLANPQLWEL